MRKQENVQQAWNYMPLCPFRSPPPNPSRLSKCLLQYKNGNGPQMKFQDWAYFHKAVPVKIKILLSKFVC